MCEHFPVLSREKLAYFRRFASWLWRDVVTRYRNQIVMTLVADGVRLVSKLGAFAVILGYAHALEKNRVLTLWNYPHDTRTSLVILLTVAVSAFVLLVIAAVSSYYATLIAVKLTRNYEEFCAQRVLVLAAHLPHPSCPAANRLLVEDNVVKERERLARLCGRFVNLILNALPPLGAVAIAVVVLFCISYVFTFIVFILSLAVICLFHDLITATLNGVHVSKGNNAAIAMEKRQLYQRIWDAPAPISYSDPALIKAYDDGETSKSLDTYYGRRFIARAKLHFAVNLLIAFSMLSIIVIAGMGIRTGVWNWSIFMAYIVALRYFFSGLSQVTNFLILTGIQYPSIHLYHEFVSDAEQATILPERKSERHIVTLRIPSLEDDRQTVDLPVGDWIYLVNSGPPSRAIIAGLQNLTGMGDHIPRPSYWFIGSNFRLDCTLRESLGLPSLVSDDEMREKLRSLIPATAENDMLKFRLDEVLTNSFVGMYPSEVLKALNLLSAIYSDRPVVVMSRKDLLENMEVSAGVPDCLLHRMVIIVDKRILPPYARNDDSLVLVSDGVRPVGWCRLGWLRNNHDTLGNRLDIKIRFGKSEDFSEPDDNEDDEEF